MNTSGPTKGHSNAIGNRGCLWFKRLRKIPNIILSDYTVSSRNLILNAEAVISVSGTACFEAGILGKRAICTADMYFRGVLALSGCSIKELCVHIEKGFSDLDAPGREILKSEFIGILKNSFNGIISDVRSNPECVNGANIISVGAGFLSIINGDDEL